MYGDGEGLWLRVAASGSKSWVLRVAVHGKRREYDPAAILVGARSYASEQRGNDPNFVKYSQNWLREEGWKKDTPANAVTTDPQKILEARAANIAEGKPYICRSISARAAGECISAGLITIEQCRVAEINI